MINSAWSTRYLNEKEFNLDPYLTAYSKINLRWTKDLNVEAKAPSFLENTCKDNLMT